MLLKIIVRLEKSGGRMGDRILRYSGYGDGTWDGRLDGERDHSGDAGKREES